MLGTLTVKDVYIKIDKYPNIAIDAPLSQAFYFMHHDLEDNTKYRTILVLNQEGHLKGYLSINDLIRAVGPNYLHKQQPSIHGNQPFLNSEQDFKILATLWQDGFKTNLNKELEKPVAECMTLVEDSVSLEDPIVKCLYMMLFHDVLILPVVVDSKVLGVIRMIDLFDLIADNVKADTKNNKEEEE